MADTEGMADTPTAWEELYGRLATRASGNFPVRIMSLCTDFGIIAALRSWASTPMPTAMVVIG